MHHKSSSPASWKYSMENTLTSAYISPRFSYKRSKHRGHVTQRRILKLLYCYKMVISCLSQGGKVGGSAVTYRLSIQLYLKWSSTGISLHKFEICGVSDNPEDMCHFCKWNSSLCEYVVHIRCYFQWLAFARTRKMSRQGQHGAQFLNMSVVWSRLTPSASQIISTGNDKDRTLATRCSWI